MTTAPKRANKYKINQLISYAEDETAKSNDLGLNLDPTNVVNKTLDLRGTHHQSSLNHSKGNFNNNNLGISYQCSAYSNTIDPMDLDSEAFDRLESFYGKIRKPSLQGCT